jgi:hypothetical protein
MTRGWLLPPPLRVVAGGWPADSRSVDVDDAPPPSPCMSHGFTRPPRETARGVAVLVVLLLCVHLPIYRFAMAQFNTCCTSISLTGYAETL